MVNRHGYHTGYLQPAAGRVTTTATAEATAGSTRQVTLAIERRGPLLCMLLLSGLFMHAAAARDKVTPGNQQTPVNHTVARHGPGGTNVSSIPKPPPSISVKSDSSQAALYQLLMQSQPRPLRLRFDYTGLFSKNSSSVLTKQEVYDIQHRFGPATAAILAKFLQVRIPQEGPLTGPIQDYAYKFCDPEVLRAVKNGINDTDILLAVTTSTNCTSKMFAWSASCDWDPITNRPTLGTMVVCPGFFKQTEGEQLATMVHESIHTLGFSNDWFDYWYDSDTGEPYKQVIQIAAGIHEPAYLVTPRTKAYAQEYFGCPALPGAPWDADSMSHWNHRGIALDLMVPHVVDTMQPSRLTPFTLKALEDTGWYVANYTLAEEPEHGRGAGCSFLMDSCSAYKASDPVANYVCQPEEYGLDLCTPDYRGVALCDYGYGGCLAPVVDLVDQPDYPLLDCTTAESVPVVNYTRAALKGQQALGGAFGANSRCLNLYKKTCTADGSTCNKYRGAVCAATSCVKEKSTVMVSFKQPDGSSGNVSCTRGHLVDLSDKLPDLFLAGKFMCPDPLVVCPTLGCTERSCPVGRGYCWEGQCRCRYMYTGPSCSTSLLPPAGNPPKNLSKQRTPGLTVKEKSLHG